MLPQNLGSSTLLLDDRGAGNLEVRPPRLVGQDRVEPEHLVGSGLRLLALEDHRQEHRDAIDLGEGRLLDLGLLPALADMVERHRHAARGEHQDVARLLALGFHDRHDRHGQVPGMREHQVDVGVHQHLVLEHLAGIGGLPQHRRLADDLDVRRFLGHHLLEALLDVERVGVAGVAQDLQHLALRAAVLRRQQFDHLGSRPDGRSRSCPRPRSGRTAWNGSAGRSSAP